MDILKAWKAEMTPEQFMTSLRGNSKEKAMKFAKKMAFVQCNETLNSKRGITTVN